MAWARSLSASMSAQDHGGVEDGVREARQRDWGQSNSAWGSREIFLLAPCLFPWWISRAATPLCPPTSASPLPCLSLFGFGWSSRGFGIHVLSHITRRPGMDSVHLTGTRYSRRLREYTSVSVGSVRMFRGETGEGTTPGSHSGSSQRVHALQEQCTGSYISPWT